MKAGCGLILLTVLSNESHATPSGWRGEAVIKSKKDAPAICLPSNATEAFPVSRILLSESYVNDPLVWVLNLKERATPVILRPGECFKFGDTPDSYEVSKSSNLNTLQKNITYVFMMDRVNDSGHYNYFYSSAFCIEGNLEDGYKYSQYTREPDGGEIIPACGFRSKREAQAWEK